MAKKFYAVKKGRETGIFTTWEACKASVNGYSGAQYKSFSTPEEAEVYLKGETSLYSEASEKGLFLWLYPFVSRREDRNEPGFPGRRGHFYEKCGRRAGRRHGGHGFL